MSGGVALLVERFAYRRLVRRNAPKYVILISAIGASFVLSETMGLREKLVGIFGLKDALEAPVVSNPRNTSILPVEIKPPTAVQHRRLHACATPTLLIILAALIMMVVSTSSSAAPPGP